MIGLYKKLMPFLISLGVLHILWQCFSIAMNSPALPSPFAVYGGFPNLLAGIAPHFWASLSRLFWGLFWSLSIGLGVGLIMGASNLADTLLSPMVYLTYPIPKMALLPVVMLLFGLGDSSKVTLIVLITVWQITVSVRDAVKSVPDSYYRVLKSLGAGWHFRLAWVTLPAILPHVFTALKLSIGTSLSILFFAENYGTKYGLGYFVQDSWMRLDYSAMYGGIVILAALGFALFALIDYVTYCLPK